MPGLVIHYSFILLSLTLWLITFGCDQATACSKSDKSFLDTVISIDLQKIDINDISILLYVYALLHSLDMLFPGVHVINFVEAFTLMKGTLSKGLMCSAFNINLMVKAWHCLSRAPGHLYPATSVLSTRLVNLLICQSSPLKLVWLSLLSLNKITSNSLLRSAINKYPIPHKTSDYLKVLVQSMENLKVWYIWSQKRS